MAIKNLDFALVGNNYLSYLLSHNLLSNGKQVVVLDDEINNFGNSFLGVLNQLDLDLLLKWGEIYKINELVDFNQYALSRPISFFVGKKQVILGNSPFRNYRELCRKFPKYFLNEQSGSLSFGEEEKNFDNNFFEFSKNVSQFVFSDNFNGKIEAYFDKNLPENLQYHFKYFVNFFENVQGLNEYEKAEFRSLVFASRAFHQRRLSPEGSRDEIFHLFISLLSPLYHIDHIKLSGLLSNVHQSLGGHIQKLNRPIFEMLSKKLKDFQYESLEGLVKPDKMMFFVGKAAPIFFKLKKNTTLYTTLQLNVVFKTALPEMLHHKKIYFTSPIKMGTERPFWEVRFNDKSGQFNVVILLRDASKIDFIRDRVVESIHDDLKYLFPEFNLTFSISTAIYTNDTFVQDRTYLPINQKRKFISSNVFSFLGLEFPFYFSKYKRHFYYGPLNDLPYGMFSTLVEIKKWRDVL